MPSATWDASIMPMGMAINKARRPSISKAQPLEPGRIMPSFRGIAKGPKVNLVRPHEPPVTYIEVIRFVIWTILVIVEQAWRDFRSFSSYRPLLSTDFMTHYFYIPVGRKDPRLVTSGPHTRMTIKDIPNKTTRQYEELKDLSIFPEREMVNCASNNYGGFSQLEYNAEQVVEAGLKTLPFAPAPDHLQTMLRSECASYMGFEACITTPSGFSTNVAAFATVATVAASQGRECVFLCDRDCHNSMFTGAYLNKGARVHKFDHNDITDLDYKLRMYREQAPRALICVAVEGIYSMEGSMSNGPAILALKRIYDFCLLVDEAHSFMAVGSAGRGSFNHWQDLGYDCPLQEVDIMTCMFSKSIGCTGGFAVANGVYAEALEAHGDTLAERGVETLATPVILRVLSILRKPALIAHRMRLVREKAKYVAETLSSAGCKVLSSPGSAIICFPVGTVRQVALFHGAAMKMGIAIVGGVPPATPMWGCRVRICIFATTTWPDIHHLLQTTITVSRKLKIAGVKAIRIDPSLVDRKEAEDEKVQKESDEVDQQLLATVQSLTQVPRKVNHLHGAEKQVVLAGVNALKKYGVGPCSARWFYGSFDIFVDLEQRLANLYPSIVLQSGRTRAMICGDAEVTIGSTLTACAVPSASNSATNVVFVDRYAPQGVIQGAELPRSNERVIIKYYDSVESIPELLGKVLSKNKLHVTMYLQTVSNGQPLNLIRLLKALSAETKLLRHLSDVTIMLDDRNGLGKIGPRSLGYLDLMESQYGKHFLKTNLARFPGKSTILVAGSWYDAFGHQGGYVTGSASAVESLTWDAKAYFFSTPPMPLQAAMSLKTIELLENSQEMDRA